MREEVDAPEQRKLQQLQIPRNVNGLTTMPEPHSRDLPRLPFDFADPLLIG
jgi:hypothetical protein